MMNRNIRISKDFFIKKRFFSYESKGNKTNNSSPKHNNKKKLNKKHNSYVKKEKLLSNQANDIYLHLLKPISSNEQIKNTNNDKQRKKEMNTNRTITNNQQFIHLQNFILLKELNHFLQTPYSHSMIIFRIMKKLIIKRKIYLPLNYFAFALLESKQSTSIPRIPETQYIELLRLNNLNHLTSISSYKLFSFQNIFLQQSLRNQRMFYQLKLSQLTLTFPMYLFHPNMKISTLITLLKYESTMNLLRCLIKIVHQPSKNYDNFFSSQQMELLFNEIFSRYQQITPFTTIQSSLSYPLNTLNPLKEEIEEENDLFEPFLTSKPTKLSSKNIISTQTIEEHLYLKELLRMFYLNIGLTSVPLISIHESYQSKLFQYFSFLSSNSLHFISSLHMIDEMVLSLYLNVSKQSQETFECFHRQFTSQLEKVSFSRHETSIFHQLPVIYQTLSQQMSSHYRQHPHLKQPQSFSDDSLVQLLSIDEYQQYFENYFVQMFEEMNQILLDYPNNNINNNIKQLQNIDVILMIHKLKRMNNFLILFAPNIDHIDSNAQKYQKDYQYIQIFWKHYLVKRKEMIDSQLEIYFLKNLLELFDAKEMSFEYINVFFYLIQLTKPNHISLIDWQDIKISWKHLTLLCPGTYINHPQQQPVFDEETSSLLPIINKLVLQTEKYSPSHLSQFYLTILQTNSSLVNKLTFDESRLLMFINHILENFQRNYHFHNLYSNQELAQQDFLLFDHYLNSLDEFLKQTNRTISKYPFHIKYSPSMICQYLQISCLMKTPRSLRTMLDIPPLKVYQSLDVNLPCNPYEIVILHILKNARNVLETEKVINMMRSGGYSMTSEIINALILDYYRHGNYIDAQDYTRELFYMYKFPPSIETFLFMIDQVMQHQNKSELKRVLSFAKQIHPHYDFVGYTKYIEIEQKYSSYS